MIIEQNSIPDNHRRKVLKVNARLAHLPTSERSRLFWASARLILDRGPDVSQIMFGDSAFAIPNGVADLLERAEDIAAECNILRVIAHDHMQDSEYGLFGIFHFSKIMAVSTRFIYELDVPCGQCHQQYRAKLSSAASLYSSDEFLELNVSGETIYYRRQSNPTDLQSHTVSDRDGLLIALLDNIFNPQDCGLKLIRILSNRVPDKVADDHQLVIPELNIHMIDPPDDTQDLTAVYNRLLQKIDDKSRGDSDLGRALTHLVSIKVLQHGILTPDVNREALLIKLQSAEQWIGMIPDWLLNSTPQYPA